jgi:3-dehydroquinate synthetase
MPLKTYQLPHGHAISIGMVLAATISEEINQFSSSEKEDSFNYLESINCQ